MFLKSITSLAGPSVEPVTGTEAFAFCRIDDTGEGTIISSLITAAREAVESYTGRALLSQQFQLTMPTWASGYNEDNRFGSLLPVNSSSWNQTSAFSLFPNTLRRDLNVIYLERSPLISVDAVKYYDATETLQTLSSANYYALTNCQPGAVALKSTASWPDLYDRPDAVQIQFTAGHGTIASSVPQTLRQAVLFLVKHYYDNRDAFVIGNGSALELPFGVKHMLESKRVGGWAA